MRKKLKMGCGIVAIGALATAFYVWVNLWDLHDALTTRGTTRLEVRATPAAGPVHMLEAVGKDGRRRSAATAASVGPDGVLLVDTLHHGAAPRLRATLDQLGSSRVRFVVNTHFHLDHVGGLEVLRDGARVVAHVNTQRRLSAPQRSFPIRAYPEQPGKLPDHAFDDSFSVTFNGEEVRAIHVPQAHTDADVVVYFVDSKVLVTGDIYNGPGRLSTPSPLQGGDPHGLSAALNDLAGWLPEDVRIIPGHGRTGALSNLEELKSYSALLDDTLAMIEQKVAAGQSLEEIQAEGLPEAWRDWPDPAAGVDRWLRALYRHFSH